MKKNILTILLIITVLTTTALFAQPDITGFARTYNGILLDNGDFSILQNTFNLNVQKTGGKIAFKANPMIYHYNSDSLDIRMRELYVDMYFNNFDIRIGKQQIVWGKADGVFITDVVSPLNLSEFLLPDFDEIRTGVIATKFDYYLGANTFELIWIPVFTPTETPDAGSIWTVTPEFLAPPQFDYSKETVKASMKNSEFFAKYTAITSAVDFEIMGGYTWDDNPTMHITRIINGIGQLVGLNVTPEHHRLTLAGGSFSTDIKGIIFRGEAAYYDGKYFQTTDPTSPDMTVQKNYLHYLLGTDFIIKGINFSTQFIQQAILDYDDNIVNEQYENTMTFLARDDYLRETLHIELFSYIGLTNNDALIRPKITYDFDDSFSILVGANIFTGDSEGRFGQYDKNDMVYTKIKYSF